MSEQKLAVITGASGGLGLVIAGEFAANGWQVTGTGRSTRPTGLSERVDYEQFDASDAAAAVSFWQQLHNNHPNDQICLVNNAGGYISGSLTETTPEGYEQQMKSIYFSAAYMTKGLAAVMSAARIINIISSSALAAHKSNSAYGAAKAAEMHFFQSIQQEFKPEQYQITNLYPLSIASHGPDPKAIHPKELADFIVTQAENNSSYYLRDVTMYPQHTV